MEIPPPPPSNVPTSPLNQPSATTPEQNNTKAVIALVLGILSLVCCTFLLGIPAIIVGRMALKDIEQGLAPQSSQGMAKAGYIMGLIATILSCVITIIYGVLFAMGMVANYPNFNI